MLNRILPLFVFLSLSTQLLSQTTSIPDPAFEQVLIDEGIDSDQTINGEVLTSDISNVTELIANLKGIVDLTGIEDFVQLTILEAYGNQINSVDLSMNTLLTELMLVNNDLTALDVTNNTNLVYLNFGSNNLTSIDLSQNPDLVYLSAGGSTFGSLDLSANPLLEEIYCTTCSLTELDISNLANLEKLALVNNSLTAIDLSMKPELWYVLLNFNNLTSIDVSTNPALYTLSATQNSIATIDLSSNPILQNLNLSNNQLAEIDLSSSPVLRQLTINSNELTEIDFSACPDLVLLIANGNLLTEIEFTSDYLGTIDLSDNLFETIDLEGLNPHTFYCSGNMLTTLDVSHFYALDKIDCGDNLLTELNVATGENSDMDLFFAAGNPGLECIQVDDSGYSTVNWTDIDPGTSFSEDCSSFVSACVEDLNGDGYVGIDDFIQLNSAYGNDCVDCPEDMNESGTVTVDDFIMLNSVYGSPCSQ